MRTISSFRLVGVLAPPTKRPIPLAILVVGAGKKPVPSNAVAFGLIMQLGILLRGNCEPRTIPAGATPPGQLANRTESDTLAKVGTKMGVETELKSPPYVAVSGTVWLVDPPSIYLRHSML